MAGRPLRNAMIDVLRQHTANWYGEDGHSALDFVIEWVENGRTIQHLIYDLTRDIDAGSEQYGLPTPTPTLSRTMLTNYLESLDPQSGTVTKRLSRARSIGAHAMVETANVALDADPADKLDRDTLNVLDRRLAAKERLAAAWNRDDFGKSAGVSVQISVADLHLAALQAPPPLRALAAVVPGEGQTSVQGGNEAEWEIEQEVGHDSGGQIATVGEKP